MIDQLDRFEDAKAIPVPDHLWTEIERRSRLSGPRLDFVDPSSPSSQQRLGAAAVALLIVCATGGFLWRAFDRTKIVPTVQSTSTHLNGVVTDHPGRGLPQRGVCRRGVDVGSRSSRPRWG
jgi:hypothetical protein